VAAASAFTRLVLLINLLADHVLLLYNTVIVMVRELLSCHGSIKPERGLGGAMECKWMMVYSLIYCYSESITSTVDFFLVKVVDGRATCQRVLLDPVYGSAISGRAMACHLSTRAGNWEYFFFKKRNRVAAVRAVHSDGGLTSSCLVLCHSPSRVRCWSIVVH
jgi:hypothetical protein